MAQKVTMKLPAINQKPLINFCSVFAAIWLVYDLIDLTYGETAFLMSIFKMPLAPFTLALDQVILIVCEICILFRFRPFVFLIVAVIARGFEAHYYPMNDFFYFCVTAAILAAAEMPGARVWARNVLVVQTGWIYFSSAFLKLNSAYLSGGDLFVRQNYTAAVMPFYYPDFFRSWISGLSVNSAFAWFSIFVEMALGFVLFSWWRWPAHRKNLRKVAIVLAVGVHGYAAYALNVFFFGASLLAQVFWVTIAAPKETRAD